MKGKWTMSQGSNGAQDRLAHLLALAINLEPMLFEEVVEVATTDNLTGAYNLSFFHASLKNELKRAHVMQYPLGLLLLEIELPDELEPEYRIMAADQALQAVAQDLEQRLRVTDWLARYGSDEFAIVLPGCPPKELEAIAQRLLGEVTSLTIPLPDPRTIELRAFIGGTVYLSGYPDLEQIIAEAEAAGAEARRHGRNGMRIHSVDPWASNQSVA